MKSPTGFLEFQEATEFMERTGPLIVKLLAEFAESLEPLEPKRI